MPPNPFGLQLRRLLLAGRRRQVLPRGGLLVFSQALVGLHRLDLLRLLKPVALLGVRVAGHIDGRRTQREMLRTARSLCAGQSCRIAAGCKAMSWQSAGAL